MKFDKRKFLKTLTKDKKREEEEEKVLNERVKIWKLTHSEV